MSERENYATVDPKWTVLKDGREILVNKIEISRTKPGKTAKHEAAHVVASGEIVKADIIAEGNALGKTRPVKLTAVSAAAAAAMGHGGTGWDRFLTENYLKVPWNNAVTAARSELSGKGELIEEVATTLQEKKIITQTDVEESKRKVDKRKNGIYSVHVVIYQKGKTESFSATSQKGVVFIPQISKN